ncbi:hypothetical protein L7Q78_35850, partial [Achromobacter xylosoxidans]|nr:hypothetical protein [Achromobacter xylosoxidans]
GEGAPAQARGGAAAGLSGRRVALLNPSQRGAPLQAATVCHQVFRWSLGRQTARGPREFPAVQRSAYPQREMRHGSEAAVILIPGSIPIVIKQPLILAFS